MHSTPGLGHGRSRAHVRQQRLMPRAQRLIAAGAVGAGAQVGLDDRGARRRQLAGVELE